MSNTTFCENEVQDSFEKEMDYFTEFQDENGLKCIFSMFDEGIKMDAQSPCRLGAVIRNECSVWGYSASAQVGGTGTWGDVYKACDLALRGSVNKDGHSDHHHYLEDLEGSIDSDGNFYWSMVMGS